MVMLGDYLHLTKIQGSQGDGPIDDDLEEMVALTLAEKEPERVIDHKIRGLRASL